MNGQDNNIPSINLSHIPKSPLLLALGQILLLEHGLVHKLALLILPRLNPHNPQTRQIEAQHLPLLRLPLLVSLQNLRQRLAESAGRYYLRHVRLQQEVGDAPRELGVQAAAEEEGEESEELGEGGEGKDEEGIV